MISFLASFIVFMLAGMPIALALGVGAAIYLYLTDNWALALAFPQRMLAGVDQFVLLTIPLFILAGNLMNYGGLTDRVIAFARAYVGHRRGGLSSVTVLASTIFSGISGSAVAQATVMGSILIPAMTRSGIPAAYAAALVGVSAIMDPIIPPSITFIVFGVLAQASIGELLIAGVVPGFLLCAGFLAYASWKAKKENFPVFPKLSWEERWKITRKTLPALGLPVLIIVGIKGGLFTATESAGIAAAYALIVGFAFRELTWRMTWDALVVSAVMTSALLVIISTANLVAFVMALEQVPTHVARGILSITSNSYLILLLINVVLLLLGMFLETITILILTMPILLQIQKIIGMDIVQFGTMVVLNVVIGMVTPPVGVCLFIVSAIAKRPLVEVSRAAMPLIGIALAVLALVALVPAVSLWLPRSFGN
jgi:tripartite ATP-independent transporter DctM subunit